MLPTTDVKTFFIKLQLVVVMINELYILQKLGLGDFSFFFKIRYTNSCFSSGKQNLITHVGQAI